VESSLNLGVLEQSGESIKLIVMIRSGVDSIREHLARRVEILAGLAGAKATRTGAYPAWQYQADSRIRELCVSVYQDVFGSAPKIKAIHAGLECGLLRVELPQTDMISFGPNLYNVHTAEEHLSIKSVANTWKFLVSVLAKLK
jgi:dipeptidase D